MSPRLEKRSLCRTHGDGSWKLLSRQASRFSVKSRCGFHHRRRLFLIPERIYLKKSCLTWSICDRQERNVGWCLGRPLPKVTYHIRGEAACRKLRCQPFRRNSHPRWNLKSGGSHFKHWDIFNLGIWMNLTYKEGDRWGPGLTVLFPNLPKERSFSSQSFLRPQNADALWQCSHWKDILLSIEPVLANLETQATVLSQKMQPA